MNAIAVRECDRSPWTFHLIHPRVVVDRVFGSDVQYRVKLDLNTATGLALKRLKALGQTNEQIFALDGDWSGLPDRDRAMLTVARKLSASPIVLTDSDVAEAVKLAGPRDVVQLINYITNRASFDRITEAAGLPIEP